MGYGRERGKGGRENRSSPKSSATTDLIHGRRQSHDLKRPGERRASCGGTAMIEYQHCSRVRYKVRTGIFGNVRLSGRGIGVQRGVVSDAAAECASVQLHF